MELEEKVKARFPVREHPCGDQKSLKLDEMIKGEGISSKPEP